VLLYRLPPRPAALVRLVGLGLIGWSIFSARHPPGAAGRDLVVTVLTALAAIAWLAWTARPYEERPAQIELHVLAAAGGLLCGATPDSAAGAFVFVAVVSAGFRVPLARAATVAVTGALGVAVSALIYDGSATGVLAYTLGYAAALLAASNIRQTIVRADQAELLLAQSQRSHEEQLRSARLEESTRIARDIHDVLAHALAGLAIQLEATTSLLERGADRDEVLARVRRAHELAREGLQETRRAVGALRGDAPPPTEAAIEALVAEYRASADAPATLTIDGDLARLRGSAGQTVVRVAQEALTNARKHAPGAGVTVAVHAGERPDDEVVLVVDDRPPAGVTTGGRSALAASGGGYGLQGMRERAQLLGGTLRAAADGDGWHVELRLPAPADGAAAGGGSR
jgi:signal transduction histidine kinase